MTDEPVPDYTTMSGAEFQRAVGTDPAKWAYACLLRLQRSVDGGEPLPHKQPAPEDVEILADWFRDAMEAARKDRIGRVLGEGEVHGP